MKYTRKYIDIMFVSNRCAETQDICKEKPCDNGGTCKKINNQLRQCICKEGFSGETCNTNDGK